MLFCLSPESQRLLSSGVFRQKSDSSHFLSRRDCETGMETATTTLLSLIILPAPLILFVFFCLFSSSRTPPKSATPTPSAHPIIGNLVSLLRNRNRFFDWVTDMLSASPSSTIHVRGPLFTTPVVCTALPANVEHLLKSNFPNYVKGSRFSDVLTELLGHGIFNVDGHLWSSQRKIASYEFNTRSLKSFVAHTVQLEISHRLLPTLAAAADTRRIFDLQDVFRRFAFDNICNLAFGDDPACLDPSDSKPQPPFVQAFDEAADICSGRLLAPTPWVWKAQRLLNVGSERRLKQVIRIVDEYAAKIIESKAKSAKNEGQDLDLLSRFASSDQDPIPQDPKVKHKFLRDIVVSFVLAGKDSTSTALTWFFWLLAMNPRCERRLYAEISEAVEKSGRKNGGGSGGRKKLLDYEELKGLNYLHAAITESLRLYPPVPIDSRMAAEDDVLPDGTRVKAGWFADYCAYAMGRMEKLWGKDCGEFVLERWLDEGGEFVPAEQFKLPVCHGGPKTPTRGLRREKPRGGVWRQERGGGLTVKFLLNGCYFTRDIQRCSYVWTDKSMGSPDLHHL